MSEIVIHGIPGSPFTRSALMGLHEKRVAYRLAVLALGAGRTRTEEHLRLHPFGRVPVMEHGEFCLYETQAILRYIDAVFPGASLQPRDARAAARMSQIANIVDWYVFPFISVGITAERFMSQRFWGRAADESNVAKALPQARTCVRELARLRGSAEYLAGDAFSIADCMVAPHLLFFRGTPEAEELMAGTALDEWLARMRARDSVRATESDRLLQAA
jgi:glutathione S-transferase